MGIRSAVLGAALAVVTGAAVADPSSLFFGPLITTDSELRVPGDATNCCYGNHPSANAYFAQSFKATGSSPTSITIGLANLLPSDVPPAPFRFQLHLIESAPGSGAVPLLWSSGPISIGTDWLSYRDVTTAISGVNMQVGSVYSWIFDSLQEQDNAPAAAAFVASIGRTVDPYADGMMYVLGLASGLGLEHDLSQPWMPTILDASFDMQFAVPEPATLALLLATLPGIALIRRRRT